VSLATDNGKLAVMEWDQDYEPGLPLSPGAFGQDDQQQILWGIPEVLWATSVPVVTVDVQITASGRVLVRRIFPGGVSTRIVSSGRVLTRRIFPGELL